MTSEEFFDYRNKLLTKLKTNICKISFKKKNGEFREMICTNRYDVIPKPIITEDKVSKRKPRVENVAVISTYDLNKREFRSFRIENLLAIESLTEEEISQNVQNTN